LTLNSRSRSSSYSHRTSKTFKKRKPSGSSTNVRKKRESEKKLKARLTLNYTLLSSNSSLKKTRNVLVSSRRQTASLEITSASSSRS